MLSARLQRALANDLSFRLALNRAVKARPPLNAWVIQNVVSDESFADLVVDALNGENPESIYRSMDLRGRQRIFRKFSMDARVALLISEWMEKSNERVRVLAGLKSRLEGLWNYLGRSKPSQALVQPDVASGHLSSMAGGWNPLVHWGLAGVLGVTTVGTAGTMLVHSYEISKEVSRISEKYSHESQSVKEEIKTIKEGCTQTQPDCKQELATLADFFQKTLTVIERNSKATRTPITRAKTDKCENAGPASSSHSSSSAAAPGLPNPWTIRLEGVPNLQIPVVMPKSVRLEPNYRLDPLPASTALLTRGGGPAQVKVEYPGSYEVAGECTLTVTLTRLADPADLRFERDEKTCNVARVAPEASIKLWLNQRPTYVPELDALISLTARRQGLWHFGNYQTSQISIQAAPYFPRGTGLDGSADTTTKAEVSASTPH